LCWRRTCGELNVNFRIACSSRKDLNLRNERYRISVDTIKEDLKRLEIRIPAWTIEDDNLSIRVRLAGD
jgi:hypothetical protein